MPFYHESDSAWEELVFKINNKTYVLLKSAYASRFAQFACELKNRGLTYAECSDYEELLKVHPDLVEYKIVCPKDLEAVSASDPRVVFFEQNGAGKPQQLWAPIKQTFTPDFYFLGVR
ncbi:hypothetical protein C4546_00515 [Candidatus Parcubacteria bacterium]|jgi:hypothetical protein|nr:MAG: hypothetical protein C4546_00515 [Candidatus Parcubacteria bacterium]